MSAVLVALELPCGVDAPRGGRTFDWRAPAGSPSNTEEIRAELYPVSLAEALDELYPVFARFAPYLVRGPDGELLAPCPRINRGALPWLAEQGFTVEVEALVAEVDPSTDFSPGVFATAARWRDGDRVRLVQPLLRPVPAPLGDDVTRGWREELRRAGARLVGGSPCWNAWHQLPGSHPLRASVAGELVPIDPPAPLARPAPTRHGRAGRPSAPAQGHALAPPTMTADEATDSTTKLLAKFEVGMVHLTMTPGTGKTHCARAAAVLRANRPHSRGAKGTGAPRGSKSALSFPTVALAEENLVRLQVAGVSVAMVRSPLSVLENGKPVCRKADVAEPMQRGGLSILRVLCNGNEILDNVCEHRSTCPAYAAATGTDADVKVLVGCHASISKLAAHVGTSGMLVIDEPPSPLVRETLILEDIKVAFEELYRVSKRYRRAVAPLIAAALAWCEHGTPGDWVALDALDAQPVVSDDDDFKQAMTRASALAEVMRAIAQRRHDPLGAPSSLEYARLAFIDPDALPKVHEPLGIGTPGAPPFLPVETSRASRSRREAAHLGRVGRVLHVLQTAACAWRGKAVLRAVALGEERMLEVELPDLQLQAALTRDGPTVLMDASLETKLPEYAVISEAIRDLVARPTASVRALARDGAPIARTWVNTPAATKNRWIGLLEQAHARHDADVNAYLPLGGMGETRAFTRGDEGPLDALTAAVAWIVDDPGEGGWLLVSHKTVADALRRALGPAIPAEVPAIGELRRLLAPLAGVRLDVAHYGAIRGLDGWKHAAGVVTLGDPFRREDEIAREAARLGLDATDRLLALAAAELEQAHGRLRAPRRSRPGRALHVGRVLPAGWFLDGAPPSPPVEVRGLRERPRGEADGARRDLARLVERVGGQRAAARVLKIDEKAVRNYLRGSRNMTPEQSRGVRAQLEALAKAG